MSSSLDSLDSLDSLEEREEPQAAGRPREPEVEEAFDRLVAEGGRRLARPLVPLPWPGRASATSSAGSGW